MGAGAVKAIKPTPRNSIDNGRLNRMSYENKSDDGGIGMDIGEKEQPADSPVEAFETPSRRGSASSRRGKISDAAQDVPDLTVENIEEIPHDEIDEIHLDASREMERKSSDSPSAKIHPFANSGATNHMKETNLEDSQDTINLNEMQITKSMEELETSLDGKLRPSVDAGDPPLVKPQKGVFLTDGMADEDDLNEESLEEAEESKLIIGKQSSKKAFEDSAAPAQIASKSEELSRLEEDAYMAEMDYRNKSLLGLQQTKVWSNVQNAQLEREVEMLQRQLAQLEALEREYLEKEKKPQGEDVRPSNSSAASQSAEKERAEKPVKQKSRKNRGESKSREKGSRERSSRESSREGELSNNSRKILIESSGSRSGSFKADPRADSSRASSGDSKRPSDPGMYFVERNEVAIKVAIDNSRSSAGSVKDKEKERGDKEGGSNSSTFRTGGGGLQSIDENRVPSRPSEEDAVYRGVRPPGGVNMGKGGGGVGQRRRLRASSQRPHANASGDNSAISSCNDSGISSDSESGLSQGSYHAHGNDGKRRSGPRRRSRVQAQAVAREFKHSDSDNSARQGRAGNDESDAGTDQENLPFAQKQRVGRRRGGGANTQQSDADTFSSGSVDICVAGSVPGSSSVTPRQVIAEEVGKHESSMSAHRGQKPWRKSSVADEAEADRATASIAVGRAERSPVPSRRRRDHADKGDGQSGTESQAEEFNAALHAEMQQSPPPTSRPKRHDTSVTSAKGRGEEKTSAQSSYSSRRSSDTDRSSHNAARDTRRRTQSDGVSANPRQAQNATESSNSSNVSALRDLKSHSSAKETRDSKIRQQNSRKPRRTSGYDAAHESDLFKDPDGSQTGSHNITREHTEEHIEAVSKKGRSSVGAPYAYAAHTAASASNTSRKGRPDDVSAEPLSARKPRLSDPNNVDSNKKAVKTGVRRGSKASAAGGAAMSKTEKQANARAQIRAHAKEQSLITQQGTTAAQKQNEGDSGAGGGGGGSAAGSGEWNEDLDRRWTEVSYLLRKPIDSEENMMFTIASAEAGLIFIDQVL